MALALLAGVALAGCASNDSNPAGGSAECGPAGAVTGWQGTFTLAFENTVGDPSGNSVTLKRSWDLQARTNDRTVSGTFFATPTGTVTIEDTATGADAGKSIRLVDAPITGGSIAFGFDEAGTLGPKCSTGFTITLNLNKTGNASLKDAHAGILVTPRIDAPTGTALSGTLKAPVRSDGAATVGKWAYAPEGPLEVKYRQLAGEENLGEATLTYDLKPV